MTSTATAMTSPAEPSELRDLGATDALEFVVEQRRAADRAEAGVLAGVVAWVDLHPVTEQTPAASWSPEGALTLGERAEHPRTARLGGVGTPGVAQFAVEEVGAGLGISYHAALQLVTDSVERRYRLPRLALVQDGRLQAWKARKVAQQTTHLSVDAVAFVKRHIATTAIRNRLPQLPALIHEALLRCDPDQAAGVEEVALNARGVWFDHRHSTATTELTASLDTPDALDLEASVSDLAVHLGRLGDTRSLQNRRATALGMLANPQRTLDLLRGADAADQQAQQSQRAGSEDHHDNVLNPATRCPATLYLHIDHDDLQAHAAAGGGAGVGTVEKLGAATLRLLQEWLARANGVTIRPVLDMTRLEGGRPARPTRLDA